MLMLHWLVRDLMDPPNFVCVCVCVCVTLFELKYSFNVFPRSTGQSVEAQCHH